MIYDMIEVMGRMKDGMQARDYQLADTQAWHGKTTIVQRIMGFAGEVLRVPCQMAGIDVPGWSWLVDSISGKPIGVPVAESYQFLPNSRWWEMVENALSYMEGAKVKSLGTFDDLAKRYVSIEIGERVKYAIGDRNYLNYFNIQGALDKTGQDVAKGSNICIVCQNTFGFSLNDGVQAFGKAKHTKNHADKWEGIEKAVEAFFNRSADFRRLMETAEETPISEERAHMVALGWLAEGKETSGRTLGTADRIRELFLTGKGNNGRTGLDLISAVTDYYSHESSGGDDLLKQVTSSEIGSGAKAKDQFLLDVRTKDFRFNKQAIGSLVKMGESSLALSAQD